MKKIWKRLKRNGYKNWMAIADSLILLLIIYLITLIF